MIRIDYLQAGYYGTAVLEDISLQVARGSIVGLLGRNGCGKTTLLRCINGLLPPMKGRVHLAGREIKNLKSNEIAALAALVPQGARTVFPLYVLDMILLGEGCHLKAWQSPSAEAEERAGALAKDIGIDHLLDKQFDRLSGGEQQLVLIARALMQSAPILLLDEPTSHLDFTNQHMVMKLIRDQVFSRGVTTVITTHDPNMALQYCSDVIMLREGRILEAGPVEDILTEENLRLLYGKGIAMEYTASCQVVVPVRDRKEWRAR